METSVLPLFYGGNKDIFLNNKLKITYNNFGLEEELLSTFVTYPPATKRIIIMIYHNSKHFKVSHPNIGKTRCSVYELFQWSLFIVQIIRERNIEREKISKVISADVVSSLGWLSK